MDNPQSTFNPETDFAAMDETIATMLTESNEPIAAYFSYAHLPPNLRAVSRKFAEVAAFIVTLPRSAERTVALRKVLEGKDAAVRASLPPR